MAVAKDPDRPRKFRETIQTIKTNETVKLVKKHFMDNKKFYMGVYVGATTCLILVQRQQIINAPVFNNTVSPVIAPVFNNTINNGGYLYKIIEDMETGDLIKKVTTLAEKIAEEHSITRDSALRMLSKHLNHPDLVPDVYGKTYTIAGTGTTGAM